MAEFAKAVLATLIGFTGGAIMLGVSFLPHLHRERPGMILTSAILFAIGIGGTIAWVHTCRDMRRHQSLEELATLHLTDSELESEAEGADHDFDTM